MFISENDEFYNYIEFSESDLEKKARELLYQPEEIENIALDVYESNQFIPLMINSQFDPDSAGHQLRILTMEFLKLRAKELLINR